MRKSGEGAHNLHDVVGLVFLRHPLDRIQRVVEEVRLDLLLKGLQFRLSLALLLLVDHVDELLDLLDHRVEALTQVADLVFLAAVEPDAGCPLPLPS